MTDDYDRWKKYACQINSSILKIKHNENSENRNAVRLVEIEGWFLGELFKVFIQQTLNLNFEKVKI